MTLRLSFLVIFLRKGPTRAPLNLPHSTYSYLLVFLQFHLCDVILSVTKVALKNSQIVHLKEQAKPVKV